MTVSSIFNDVIGPVMRGPSSSHSAAGCRIGLLLRDLIAGGIEDVVIDHDPHGSLVTTDGVRELIWASMVGCWVGKLMTSGWRNTGRASGMPASGSRRIIRVMGPHILILTG